MAVKQDYYEILGVARDATDEEIKRAFRRLAFQYHPDHNHDSGAADRFKEINEAYECLSTPEKRASYDRYGHAGNNGDFGQDFDNFNFGGFGDIFDTFFGAANARSQTKARRGEDLRCDIAITLEEAAFGCEKEIEVERTEACELCRGTGCKPGSQPSRCPTCEGAGYVRRVQQNIFGRFVNMVTCGRCGGEGKVITDPCEKCRGTGRQKRLRNIVVEISPGIADGAHVRLSGEGGAGDRGGQAGDLYITFAVLPHELFTREGDDVLYELPVNFAQSALGDHVEVPTLEGAAKLKIPAGSQTGSIFRLKNKGIPHLHKGGRGDQLVKLKVVTPESLTDEQRKLLKALSESFSRPKKGAKPPA
ncbi:MAG: molecular chaperone DnaJ [Chloroflexi bacterium]|nr:molecular chaperone DnaJ [Chloroflexota bacterium]